MQSTEPHRVERVAERVIAGLLRAAQHGVRLSAVPLWIGIGSYAWYRPILSTPYTVVLVGCAVGFALLAALVGVREGSDGWAVPVGRRPWVSRLLLGGCLIGVTVGTVGIVRAVDQITASQPQPSMAAVVAGTILVVSLLVLVDRVFGSLVAGLAVLAIGAGVAAPELSLIETLVFSPEGIYGPLTEAAATWIAPLCLLAGLWRAAGTERRLRALWPVESRAEIAGIGFVAVLIAWQTAGTDHLTVIGLAVSPALLIWTAALFRGGREAASEMSTTAMRAVGPLLMVGGPLTLMGVLRVGYRPPVGIMLVAGCLLLIGCCLLQPLIRWVAPAVDSSQETGVLAGVDTVLDGGVQGLELLARVVLVLAVVGGVANVIRVAGMSTGLLSTLLWLAGGQTAVVGLALGGLCVALGVVLSTVGGYAMGALVVVPLLRTVTPVAELTAQLLVCYGVVLGGVLAPRLGDWMGRLKRVGTAWRGTTRL